MGIPIGSQSPDPNTAKSCKCKETRKIRRTVVAILLNHLPLTCAPGSTDCLFCRLSSFPAHSFPTQRSKTLSCQTGGITEGDQVVSSLLVCLSTNKTFSSPHFPYSLSSEELSAHSENSWEAAAVRPPKDFPTQLGLTHPK